LVFSPPLGAETGDDLADDAYQSYLLKHENWNFWVNALDLTFYNLAMSFIYGATVLSLYASYLTDSAILIGLIPAVQGVMFLLPQLLMAQRTEGLARKKPLVVRISVLERLPYLVVGLAILLWPGAPRPLAYLVLLLALITATGAGGLAGPAWKTMLAKVVPVRRRGRLFGLSSALGGLLGLAGAAVSRQVLSTYAYPVSFAICFLLCFVFQVFSYICVALNREPARQPEIATTTPRTYWRRLPAILRRDRNFGRYLISHGLLSFGAMGAALYIVYARRTFAVSDAFAANLTMAALFGQIVSTPLMGRLADLRGNKWLMELGALLRAAAVLVILIARSPLALYPAFVIFQAATATGSLASMGITMEFCSEDEMPTYTALASTLSGIPVLLAPLLAGWLADAAGFQTLFVVSVAFALAGWAMARWGMQEPRQHRTVSPAGAAPLESVEG
jgi:MFS family permease